MAELDDTQQHWRELAEQLGLPPHEAIPPAKASPLEAVREANPVPETPARNELGRELEPEPAESPPPALEEEGEPPSEAAASEDTAPSPERRRPARGRRRG